MHPGWSPLSVPGCWCRCRKSLGLLWDATNKDGIGRDATSMCNTKKTHHNIHHIIYLFFYHRKLFSSRDGVFFATHSSITKTTIHLSHAKTNKDATNACKLGKMQQVHVTWKKCTHNINIIYLFIYFNFPLRFSSQVGFC